MFLNIAYINKVNIASLNGSESTGGNLTAMKKVSSFSGDEYAYVSGQALRHYFKETLVQLGESITEVDESGEPTFRDENFGDAKKGNYVNLNTKWNENLRKKIFEDFCDLDLFGYMFPKGYRRWSPVKVTPMMSILPYKGEYDYLTRKQKPKGEDRSGNIVQVEIDTLNFMRGNILLNLDHIGAVVDEYSYDVTKILKDDKKNNRINIFIDAIKALNGGAKQARNLEDISPKFVVATKQNTGNPFLLNAMSVDKEGNINIEMIKEAIKDSGIGSENIFIGISRGIFTNEDAVRKEFENVMSVSEALESLKENGSN
jgi:CRISPR-associated protein Cst2